MTNDLRLHDLVKRWQDLRDQGRPADPAELCRDCPELRQELEREVRNRSDKDTVFNFRVGDDTQFQLPPGATQPERSDQPRKEPNPSDGPASDQDRGAADREWQRVAADLIAYRDAQKQLWGGLDDGLIARYLAGDCTPPERQRVEETMSSHPEVRACVDLVREVLAIP
jgi:hypothetical protein